MTSPTMRLAATLPLLACLALTGCGKKGPLIPPEALVPAPINDIQVNQKGNQLQLSWSAPTRDDHGGRLRNLAGFILMRHEVLPPQNECDSCADAYRAIARIDLEFPKGVHLVDGRYLFADRELTQGKSYRYKARSFKKDGTESKDSNRAEVTFMVPPPPPSLSVVSSSASVVLTFSSPPPREGTLIGYNIYRSADKEGFPQAPLNAAPVPSAPYTDPLLKRTVHYHYRVTSLVKVGNNVVESPPSEEAEGYLQEPD